MIKLIGIPYDHNSSFLKGPALAPERIRMMEKEGSANRFSERGGEIHAPESYIDMGDLEVAHADSKTAFALIKGSIEMELSQHHKTLCIGGDHSITWPIIDAYAAHYQPLHILHLDAHSDLYQDFEGNPYSHASPFARIMESHPTVSLTQVGIRTLNRHQREQAEKYKVNIVEMKDFSMGFIGSLKSPLYLSVDLDVLDPAFAPGVSHHEPGGLSTRQLLQIVQSLELELVGADLVEYNPTRDWQNVTAMAGYKILKELISKMLPAPLS